MTEALRAPVHLRLGRTTLGEVVKALAGQTKQSIECDSYLQEHRLTVQIESASAADALNELVELNNLRWTEAGSHRILLTRARAKQADKQCKFHCPQSRAATRFSAFIWAPM